MVDVFFDKAACIGFIRKFEANGIKAKIAVWTCSCLKMQKAVNWRFSD